MVDAIVPMLRTLHDIEGVLGSFLVGEDGQLLARDVPAACGSDVLLVVGSRLHQLCDAFLGADIGGAFESTTLSFAQYKLHVRALGNAFLVALLSSEANMPALKMAMNMVGRRVLAELGSRRLTDRPSDRVTPVGPAPESNPAVPERSYRGRRFSG